MDRRIDIKDNFAHDLRHSGKRQAPRILSHRRLFEQPIEQGQRAHWGSEAD